MDNDEAIEKPDLIFRNCPISLISPASFWGGQAFHEAILTFSTVSLGGGRDFVVNETRKTGDEDEY